jgi:hypothetical protein
MCGRRGDCKLLFGAKEKAEKAVVFRLSRAPGLAFGHLEEQEHE